MVALLADLPRSDDDEGTGAGRPHLRLVRLTDAQVLGGRVRDRRIDEEDAVVSSGADRRLSTRVDQSARLAPAVLLRRRILAAVVAAMVIVAFWIALQALLGGTGGGPLAATGLPSRTPPAGSRVWVVRPGDTLWTIALASGAKGDIRPYVDRLSAEVGGRPLVAGERIVLP